MLKKANMQWNGKKIAKEIEKNNLLFDCTVQRSLVWDLERKSLLINSMISDYPIPPFYFARREDGKYDALDGKQRSNTISQFVNGEFALSKNAEPVTDENGNEFEIAEKHFNELSEWIQDQILNYSLTIYYFDGITEDEIHELFFRINNGKPLTSVELTRVKALSLEKFQEIAKHELIDSIVNEKSKAKYNDENIAMQAWALCFAENPDMTTKEFRPLIENARVTENQIEILNQAMNYIVFAISELDLEDKDQKRVLTKIKRKSHVTSCIYFAKKCVELEITKERFFEAVYKFFNTTKTSINDNYNNTCGSGSARKENVQKRMEAMDALVGFAQRHIEEQPTPIIHTDFEDFDKEEAV